jgi:hypothetical protein
MRCPPSSSTAIARASATASEPTLAIRRQTRSPIDGIDARRTTATGAAPCPSVAIARSSSRR